MTIHRNKEQDRHETLRLWRQLHSDNSTPISPTSWLGHTGKCAKIDWMLIYGASIEKLETSGRSVSSIHDHIRHLNKEHGLKISNENRIFQYAVNDLEKSIEPERFDENHIGANLENKVEEIAESSNKTEFGLGDGYDEVGLFNQTKLDPVMVKTVAKTAKFFVDSEFGGIDRNVAERMVGLGIRTIHDKASSPRGNGKYLGHDCWSKSALKLLKDNGGSVVSITRKLSHEHAIPISYIVKDVLFDNEPGIPVDIYESQIDEFSVVVIITREENSQLSAYGYANKMPDNWQDQGEFVRYKLAGLYDELETSSLR